jgi:hypothetical protein
LNNIFTEISDKAPVITDDDLDSWVVPKLMEHYDIRLNALARKTYGTGGIALSAFKQHSKTEIRGALDTFLFKKEHWRNNRNLNSYLLTCLKRLSNRLFWDQNVTKSFHMMICPACKYGGRKEAAMPESGMLRCRYCTHEADRLGDELKIVDPTSFNFAMLQTQYKLHVLFSLYSKAGFKCPECALFIPESIINGRVICPYPDCIYIGDKADLSEMSHPTCTASRGILSLNVDRRVGADVQKEWQDLLGATDTIDPIVCIDVNSQFNKEYDVLVQVIGDQINSIKRTNNSSTIIQKLLMYQAYKSMLDKYPEDMISYLAHVKQNSDFPIQSRIFQEYVSLVENYLPFSIEKGGKSIDIISLTDPNLALFEGVSEFESQVDKEGIIPNNTAEEYIGGRNFKNYGRCFIGKIVDIKTNDGKSIKDKIIDYSFVQIKMDSSVVPGTTVNVKHFRILPHYEMRSMVFLQRIRRKIVDSVYFKLHGIRR